MEKAAHFPVRPARCQRFGALGRGRYPYVRASEKPVYLRILVAAVFRVERELPWWGESNSERDLKRAHVRPEEVGATEAWFARGGKRVLLAECGAVREACLRLR